MIVFTFFYEFIYELLFDVLLVDPPVALLFIVIVL